MSDLRGKGREVLDRMKVGRLKSRDKALGLAKSSSHIPHKG
jgi:hypothetical protein